MYDTVITGGVLADGSGPWDIGIKNGKIASIDTAGTLDSLNKINAEKFVILPGLVDAHVHARDPGFTHKESFKSLTMAAAAGGVTTAMAMPNSNPPLTNAAAIQYAEAQMNGNDLIDVSFIAGACMATPKLIPSLAQAGAIALDVYDNPFAYGTAQWMTMFQEAQKTKLPLCFYLLDSILEANNADVLDRQGVSEVEKIANTSNGLSECAAIARIFPMAARFNVPVVLRMVTTAEGIQFIRKMREIFPTVDVAVEVCVHYLFLTSDALSTIGGRAHIHPPLRSENDIKVLWEALKDGTVDYIGSDHAPHAPYEKAGENLSDCSPGIIGLETMLPLLLTACAEEQLNLIDIERLCCKAPAQIYGLYPRKGAIQVGSDADIVLIDPDKEWKIDGDHFYSQGDKGPFDGRVVKGYPHMTFVRGEKVMEEGQIIWEKEM